MSCPTVPENKVNLSIPPELETFAERMGELEFKARIEREQRLVCDRGHGIWRVACGNGAWFDFYAFVRLCLKASGLWKRAVRNYLDIQVVENEVYLDRLPAAFDGFRLLQLSDLHADLHPDFPAAVKSVIADIQCDAMVVTGDFRTCTFGDHTGATEATIEIFKEVEVPLYAVLGNHDFLIKVPRMEAAGIQFLLNEHVILQRGEDILCLTGIDDPNLYGTHNLERALSGVPVGTCKILLSHSPQTCCEAAALGFDFQLSGHTHGGQICPPGGTVIMHDGQSPRHVMSGPWREGQLQGYTSRGTGGTGLPARLNCPAEVTVHILRSPKTE